MLLQVRIHLKMLHFLPFAVVVSPKHKYPTERSLKPTCMKHLRLEVSSM